MENYYKLFEISNDADISQLKSAFRKKAKSCHPDLFQHVSAEERKNLQIKFVRLSKAYEILSDPKKRQLFDLRLRKSVMMEQKNHNDNRKTKNFSETDNYRKYTSFSNNNNKSTSKDSADTIEDLIIDVEKILSQFGLNFKDPLDMLVDWARGVYQDLTCTFNEEGEYNKNHAGSKNKSQNSEHNYSHPLQNIEEELKRLKAKHIKTEFSKRESKEYKSSFENIEQELLSIKKKYKL